MSTNRNRRRRRYQRWERYIRHYPWPTTTWGWGYFRAYRAATTPWWHRRAPYRWTFHAEDGGIEVRKGTLVIGTRALLKPYRPSTGPR